MFFLHGELDGKYMNQPKKFENEIGVMSQYIQSLMKPHLGSTWKILRYVKVTIGYGHLYKPIQALKQVGYCNVDYARYHNIQRSNSEYVFSSVREQFLCVAKGNQ